MKHHFRNIQSMMSAGATPRRKQTKREAVNVKVGSDRTLHTGRPAWGMKTEKMHSHVQPLLRVIRLAGGAGRRRRAAPEVFGRRLSAHARLQRRAGLPLRGPVDELLPQDVGRGPREDAGARGTGAGGRGLPDGGRRGRGGRGRGRRRRRGGDGRQAQRGLRARQAPPLRGREPGGAEDGGPRGRDARGAAVERRVRGVARRAARPLRGAARRRAAAYDAPRAGGEPAAPMPSAARAAAAEDRPPTSSRGTHPSPQAAAFTGQRSNLQTLGSPWQ